MKSDFEVKCISECYYGGSRELKIKSNILVVDDLEINRKVLDGYLSSDYGVLLAEGGHEALDLLGEHEVSLAILDVNMPNMDGFELAQRIRQLPSCEELPIIFVTGAALEQSQVIQGLSVGAVDYMCKPYDMKVLFMKVHNFVALSEKNRALKQEIEFRKESQKKLQDSLEREQHLSEKLKLAEKMEAIGRLSSGISHDFNNLMTALTGYAELLKQTDLDGCQVKHVGSILNICGAGIDISEKLKVFSKQRSSRKKVFDMTALLRDLRDMCDFSIEKHINKSFHLPLEKVKVFGSSSDILNCLLNIILNARDSIHENGQLDVSCSLENLSQSDCQRHSKFSIEAGEFIRITVKDDGSGMSEDVLQKIFEPFFSTKGDKGTGLGMATSFGTIIEHNGSMDIQSTLGEGTSVHIFFPVDSHKENTESRSSALKVNLNGKKILIVDDEEQNLEYMKVLFETYGAQVEAYTDVKKALSYFEQNNTSTDLVVIDYIMPELNGCGLLHKMKEIKPGIKAIIVSGVCQQSEIDKLREMGIDAITKPFHVQEFIEQAAEKISAKEEA